MNSKRGLKKLVLPPGLQGRSTPCRPRPMVGIIGLSIELQRKVDVFC